jgi:hypothetical protein
MPSSGSVTSDQLGDDTVAEPVAVDDGEVDRGLTVLVVSFLGAVCFTEVPPAGWCAAAALVVVAAVFLAPEAWANAAMTTTAATTVATATQRQRRRGRRTAVDDASPTVPRLTERARLAFARSSLRARAASARLALAKTALEADEST